MKAIILILMAMSIYLFVDGLKRDDKELCCTNFANIILCGFVFALVIFGY